MADDHERPPLQGDEEELFRAYNDELVRRVARSVNTSLDVVEDACAMAWVQFLRYQPDRDRNWRSWMHRVAEREAWRLDGISRESMHFSWADHGPGQEPPDPHDRFEISLELDDAMEVLGRLTERQRSAVFLRSLGVPYQELADVMGTTPRAADRALARGRAQIYRHLESRRTVERSHGRAGRLEDLEGKPPPWLVSLIGRPPSSHLSLGPWGGAPRLAWRRAALAIDDYRREYGLADESPSTGAAQRAWSVVAAAIERLERLRAPRRDTGRER